MYWEQLRDTAAPSPLSTTFAPLPSSVRVQQNVPAEKTMTRGVRLSHPSNYRVKQSCCFSIFSFSCVQLHFLSQLRGRLDFLLLVSNSVVHLFFLTSNFFSQYLILFCFAIDKDKTPWVIYWNLSLANKYLTNKFNLSSIKCRIRLFLFLLTMDSYHAFKFIANLTNEWIKGWLSGSTI